MKNLSVLIFVFVFLFLSSTSSTERKQKISDINVLLPICDSPNCNRVYYNIHARGGCYEW